MTFPAGTVTLRAGSAFEVRSWGEPGGAAPIVLLHEGLGSVGLWRDFPSRLQRRTDRYVVAFSRYGHGRSGAPPRQRTTRFFHEEALEVLPELLAELKIREPVLLGHSDGASIALIYAASHPVSALVLLAPHVFVEDVTVEAIRRTRQEYVSGELRARMERHHDNPDLAFWGWCSVWLDPAFLQWNLFAEAAQQPAPTLLVQGADDPYGTMAQIDEIEQRTRGMVERVVVSGGHAPHLEHGERLVDDISEFLVRVASTVQA